MSLVLKDTIMTDASHREFSVDGKVEKYQSLREKCPPVEKRRR
jgi:hypothetical protein